MNKPLTCYLTAIDICTPNLLNWSTAQAYLVNSALYQLSNNHTIPLADILSPREKRRASNTVNLSLHLANQIQQQMKVPPEQLQTVFATSDGDSDIFDYLSKELSQAEPAISPTLFHQSLHNSAAGYWGIATHSHQPSISISAGDSTFSGGLLTAICDTLDTKKPTAFIAYNLPSPSPMCDAYPMLTWFGVGLGLSHVKDPQAFAKISLKLVEEEKATSLKNASLETLRIGNPIAHCLPFLEQLAMKNKTTVYIDYLPPYCLEILIEEYYS